MVSDRPDMTRLPHGTTGNIKALGEQSAPKFPILLSDSGEPFGPGVDCGRTSVTSQRNRGLAGTERRELVLVEAERDHGWAAFGDALPGKKHRENIRGWAKSLPEKDNERSNHEAGQ
jgi:hypothetical protein